MEMGPGLSKRQLAFLAPMPVFLDFLPLAPFSTAKY